MRPLPSFRRSATPSPRGTRGQVLTPSVRADHAGEPEQHARAGDERGANDRPFVASGHERSGYDADALEKEHNSGEQRDDGDAANGESHG